METLTGEVGGQNLLKTGGARLHFIFIVLFLDHFDQLCTSSTGLERKHSQMLRYYNTWKHTVPRQGHRKRQLAEQKTESAR